MLADADLISIQEVRTKVEKAYAAFQQYRTYSQERVDAIVEAMAAAARAHSQRLAELAVEETGYGNAKDKLAKNLLCADLLPRRIRGMKTIGVLREVPEDKIVEMAVPVGVVAAILPTTNPTSTAIYKTIVSLKAGNSIVISPHPRAARCTCETADVLYQAALAAGAPPDIIQCVNTATMEGTNALMKHHRTGVILATGGSGMVRAAYSSGKPAYGVGPGNVPVLLDDSHDVNECVAKVVIGKSFDYGTVCSSEQTLIASKGRRDAVLAALRDQKAFLCNADQAKALSKLLITPKWAINPECVGQAPTKIARMAGFEVPAETSIIAVEIGGVGKEHPLSMEKLSPVLSLLFLDGWEEQVRACQAILKFGGLGHTCAIYSTNDARTREYGLRMPAFRVLVNTPTPQGSTGITTGVQPSMTLGCGAMAGNITSDNVGPQHLLNVKRLAYVVRTVEEAFPDAPPVAASASQPRSAIVSAVEKFLVQRGVSGVNAPASRPTASPVAGIVDRFLQAKSAPSAASASAGSCGCGPTLPAPVAAAPTAPAPPPAPPAPVIEVVDFVCEADVRIALHKSQKIYIGPKTIVTPAARELANQHDLLVVAQR
ncbi:MAG: aldehyde dehydrogenase family protein [Acidobacteriota bacterium]